MIKLLLQPGVYMLQNDVHISPLCFLCNFTLKDSHEFFVMFIFYDLVIVQPLRFTVTFLVL